MSGNITEETVEAVQEYIDILKDQAEHSPTERERDRARTRLIGALATLAFVKENEGKR